MKINSKNIAIVILIVVVIILSIFLIIKNKNNGKGNSEIATFIKDAVEVQNNLSYYVGNTYSDTFGIYTKEEIVTARKKDAKENSDISKLTSIVDTNSKIDSQNGTCYKISEENYKKILNVDLPKYDGITWYIQDGSLIKVHLNIKPDWWNEDLSCLEI